MSARGRSHGRSCRPKHRPAVQYSLDKRVSTRNACNPIPRFPSKSPLTGPVGSPDECTGAAPPMVQRRAVVKPGLHDLQHTMPRLYSESPLTARRLANTVSVHRSLAARPELTGPQRGSAEPPPRPRVRARRRALGPRARLSFVRTPYPLLRLWDRSRGALGAVRTRSEISVPSGGPEWERG